METQASAQAIEADWRTELEIVERQADVMFAKEPKSLVIDQDISYKPEADWYLEEC